MKGFFVDHDLGVFDALVVPKFACQFDSGFVGLETAVAEEHVAHVRVLDQFGRQHFGVGGIEVVAAVDDFFQLLLQRRHQFGVVVAQGVDRNTR